MSSPLRIRLTLWYVGAFSVVLILKDAGVNADSDGERQCDGDRHESGIPHHAESIREISNQTI